MPRYFFDLHDGVDIDDLHGLELIGLDAAVSHARKIGADLSKSGAFANGKKCDWELAIRDEEGDVLHSVSFREFVEGGGRSLNNLGVADKR